MFYAVSKDFRSLRNISKEAQLEHSIEVSKQGLDSRFSQASVDFSKELLKQALANQFREVEPIVNNQLFKRILIKDSTRFDIDKSLKKDYPSFGGNSSPAGVSIQMEYDLITGKINDLELHSALDRDSVDSMNKLGLICAGDLIIRDLGYFHLKLIEYINEQKAFIISRLQSTTKVYASKDCDETINFTNIYNHMMLTHTSYMDLNVFVGSKMRLPMRLVIALLPDDIYKERLRKRNKDNKEKGFKTSQDYRDKARFNLFISNVPEERISDEEICRLYRARWQVELIFKTWKSLIRISDLRKMRCVRLQTTLYMKLLWVVVHWEIIQPYRNYVFKRKNKILSVFKCVDTLQERAKTIRLSLSQGKRKFINILKETYFLFSKNHWLEKRNNRDNFGDLVLLFI